MSQWTSKYAILRDLSVAQGSVPVAIEGTVGAGDKPPSLNINEETEEEFFKHCSGEADVSIAPDLRLIKQMLDMVRGSNDLSDEEDLSNKAVVISKLNPLSPEFVQKPRDTSTPICQSPMKQKKKDKTKKRPVNVAVESILKAIADSKNGHIAGNPEPIKLLKPNDFISNTDLAQGNTEIFKCVEINQTENTFTEHELKTVIEDTKDVSPTAIEKVNGWLNTQTDSPFPKRVPKVTLEATNMRSIFKRKTVPEKVKSNETVKSPASSSVGEYKPSMLANEYYQKYVERSKFKESVKDDIWSKAEKKMKEIDKKRRLQSTRTFSSPSTASKNGDQSFEDTQSGRDCIMPVMPLPPSDIDIKDGSDKISRCLDQISLPQHRHLLPGECIVCKVLTKKPTDSVNEEVMKDTELNITEYDEKTEDAPKSDGSVQTMLN